MLTFAGPTSHIPRGGFRYVHQEDGHVTEHIVLEECYRLAVEYRHLNRYPVPLNFRTQMEDAMCKQVDQDGICVDDSTRKAYRSTHRPPLSALEIWNGTKFLADYLKSGLPEAPEEEVKQRIGICTACEFNVTFDEKLKGCSTCGVSKVAHAIMDFIMRRQTLPGEDKLKACAHCGCSLKALVRPPLDLIQKHLPDYLNERLPSHCWKKRK